jgi:uncharacterized SAM-binding protein YcdF (DUF218 family)
MLFWLKEILTLPFLPLHFTLIAGTIGLVLLFWPKRQKLGRALLIMAVLSLALFSNKGVARFLIAPLESQYTAIPEARVRSELPAQVQACRTIVVLGGGHSDSTTLSRVNQLSTSALARLTEAVRLARLIPEAKLIVSGYDGPRKASHAQILAEAAISLGVAPERIVRLDTTRDTDDEAQELARRLGAEPFLLVTSAWHMPRAMALCEKNGLHPIATPTDFMLRPEADAGWRLLVWDLGALERSTKAIHERIGLVWSKLRGQI